MTTTLRERVLAAVPGYTDAHRIKNTARTRAAEFPKPDYPAKRAHLNELITAALANGTALPLEYAQEVATAEQDARAIEIMAEEYRVITARAADDLDDIDPGRSGEAFQVLADEMQNLVDEGRQLIEALDGATEAAAVLNRGPAAIEAWNALTALTDTYNEIRAVQLDLTGRAYDGRQSLYYSTALLRDGIDRGHYWINRRRDSVAMSSATDSPHVTWLREAGTPAPFESDTSWWPAETDPTAHLVRILTHSDPWVPDTDTLARTIRFAEQATAPLHDDAGKYGQLSADAIDHALTQYRRLTADETEQDAPEIEQPDMRRHNRIAKQLNDAVKINTDRAARAAEHARINQR